MAPSVKYEERVVCFRCQNQLLAGVLAAPEAPATRGVLIVVGGPQYRVGSHRQFLTLSRQLAEAGVPALRFDYRGMGDSEGETRTFEAIDEDLASAVDVFFNELPALN